MKIVKTLLKIIPFLFGALFILVIFLYGHRDIPLNELKAKYGRPPSLFLAIEGMNVHYRDEGNKMDTLPIVLIHGTGASLHTFDAWTVGMKSDFRVVRMDLPGFGLTGPFSDRTYSMENYVMFLREFLAATGIDQCVLAGNSLGGHIAWRFALEYPEMVDRLILIDASGYPAKSRSTPIAFKLAKIPVLKNVLTFITPRFMAKSSLENVYFNKTKVTPELIDRYFELTLRAGNRQGLIDRMAMHQADSNHLNIKNIQHPTLILWGEQDELIPAQSALRFHEDLPNDTLVVVGESGHVPMEESPERSLAIVLNFLGRN